MKLYPHQISVIERLAGIPRHKVSAVLVDESHYSKMPDTYAELVDKYIPEDFRREQKPLDIFIPDKDYEYSSEPTTTQHDPTPFQSETQWLADISKKLWEDVLPKNPVEPKEK